MKKVDQVKLDELFEAVSTAAKKVKPAETSNELLEEAMDYHADQDLVGLKKMSTKKELKMKKVVAKPAVKKPVVKKTPVKAVAKKVVAKPVEEKVEPVAAPAKKPVVKKTPVKPAEKAPEKDVVVKPAAPAAPAAEPTTGLDMAALKAIKVDESSEPVTEFIGLKVGDKITHPKNGEGEVEKFIYNKDRKFYYPIINFNGKKSGVSPYVAITCLIKE